MKKGRKESDERKVKEGEGRKAGLPPPLASPSFGTASTTAYITTIATTTTAATITTGITTTSATITTGIIITAAPTPPILPPTTAARGRPISERRRQPQR